MTRRFALALAFAFAAASVVAWPVAAELLGPEATTLTRVCAEGQTLTFSFGGFGAQWAVHIDAIDGVPADGILVIVYWAVFNPATGTTIVFRDVPTALDLATCTFTSASGRVVTVKYFTTPPEP